MRPMKRPESKNHYYVCRIPHDVLPKAPGVQLNIPVGDISVTKTISRKAVQVRVSLRTSDPAEGLRRHAAIHSYLADIWQSLRDGPQRLTHEQVVSLAGDAYKTVVSNFKADPDELLRLPDDEVVKDTLDRIPEELRRDAIAQGAGMSIVAVVDCLVAKRGLEIDLDSRLRLAERVIAELQQATERLKANAEGDYSPDTYVARFPEWVCSETEVWIAGGWSFPGSEQSEHHPTKTLVKV